jgi:hypothetical protein
MYPVYVKVNMWAGLMHDKLIGPFFFLEKTVTGRSYLIMLELYHLKPSSSKMGRRHIYIFKKETLILSP